MYKNFNLILLFFCLCLTRVEAQDFFFKIKQNIPIQTNQLLSNAWAGGLNSPQFSTMDLNFDDVNDIVVFERTSSKIFTFLGNKTNQSYTYAPEYENFFPKNMAGWMLLRDYDGDGKKDIFTKTSLGIKVYQNKSHLNQRLVWEEVSKTLFSESNTRRINLQVPVTDIPCITDIDDDGDLDILVFDFTGGFIELHQNMSQERYNNNHHLEYSKQNSCWGGIQELQDCGSFSFQIKCSFEKEMQEKSHNGLSKKPFHLGSSILVLDINGDKKKDLLLGDVSCNPVYTFINKGSNLEAYFKKYTINYPKSKPIHFKVFPALYWEDVNFDGKKDLLACPNTFNNAGNMVDFSASVWHYENKGSNQKPKFEFTSTNFLQKQMLDLGENIAPVFVDYDGDGDLDMFIGNEGRLVNDKFVATISYFENTGNKAKPAFKLKNKDFLGLSKKQWTGIKLYFQDWNNDKKIDLLITTNKYRKTTTYALLNESHNKKLVFDKDKIQKLELPLNYQDYALFVDYDNDNDLDLLIAQRQGNLLLYEHKKQLDKTYYVLKKNVFKNFNKERKKKFLKIAINDINDDQKLDLVCCDISGSLSIYASILENLGGDWEEKKRIIWNPLAKQYDYHKFGTTNFPTLADLNNDGMPDIIIGSNTGGLYYLENDNQKINLPIPKKEEVFISQNTVNLNNAKEQYIYIIAGKRSKIQVIDSTGKPHSKNKTIKAQEILGISIKHLKSGTYYLNVANDKRVQNKKFVIQ